MTISRKEQIFLEETTFYHCMVRCVRRAYLCGNDPISGENFDHRKQWVVHRMRQLASIFCIDVCAYAVMSNHYHVILHVDISAAEALTEEAVCERWQQLFKANDLIKRYLNNDNLTIEETNSAQKTIDEWRSRLMDISWFMRCMNETIARSANKEDNTKGRFWEGRFKSQALLDDLALLTCMAYIDLNPVRAGISDSLEDSDFTSIQYRLFEKAKHHNNKPAQKLKRKIKAQENTLKDFFPQLDIPQAPLVSFDSETLPMTWLAYTGLVEETGKAIRDDKKGFLKKDIPEALTQLGVDDSVWLETIKHYKRKFGFVLGSADKLRIVAAEKDKAWCKGVGCGQGLYQSQAAA